MRTRFWLRLWAFARERAKNRLLEEWPGEFEDARRAWRSHARLYPPLDGPAWNTKGLPTDLALHDALDSLLGRQVY